LQPTPAPDTSLAAVKEENPDKKRASAAPGASRLKLSLGMSEQVRKLYWIIMLELCTTICRKETGIRRYIRESKTRGEQEAKHVRTYGRNDNVKRLLSNKERESII